MNNHHAMDPCAKFYYYSTFSGSWSNWQLKFHCQSSQLWLQDKRLSEHRRGYDCLDFIPKSKSKEIIGNGLNIIISYFFKLFFEILTIVTNDFDSLKSDWSRSRRTPTTTIRPLTETKLLVALAVICNHFSIYSVRFLNSDYWWKNWGIGLIWITTTQSFNDSAYYLLILTEIFSF